MRILLNFTSQTERDLTKNIRSSFISFIKKTFEVSNQSFYKSLFEFKKSKPYVFSPYFGEEFEKGKIGKAISIIFSSGDFSVISYFWNGLLALKENKNDFIRIEKNDFHLENILLLQEKKVKSNQVIFKTIGVSILTDPEKSANDFKNWYIIPGKEDIERFNEVLRKRTEERLKYIKGIEKKVNLEFLILEENSIVETIVPHYNGYVRGFRGKFVLKGDIEVLQFLYDFGFGVRTGQGFGLLEVIENYEAKNSITQSNRRENGKK
ncbi:MAG: CRISPR-associated endoribonuclease Cas6 [Candidatus Omnitrophica bacterium]|nr:CRISPR-associated endoribonuclease Cas6 [Candidatus Omnitrophota bacterium]MCM8803352.1 CRISPR-associated endoribonuclease Cas6 [Candidatus Omnitrophota bacterium]